MKKAFLFWGEESEIEKIKQKAKQENRSASSYVRNRALSKIIETPNIAMGNWWDNPTAIRKIARELTKQMK